MALSMDEQRVLAEIERRLAAEDPRLATCMSAFKRPAAGNVLHTPRARIIGSLFTVLLIAMISLMVYAMIPFRTQSRAPAGRPATSPAQAVITATGGTGNPAGATGTRTSTGSTGGTGTGGASSGSARTPAPSAKSKSTAPLAGLPGRAAARIPARAGPGTAPVLRVSASPAGTRH